MNVAWILFVWVCSGNADTLYQTTGDIDDPVVLAIPTCDIEHPPTATRFIDEFGCRDAAATYAKIGSRMPNLRWECIGEAK